MYVFTFNILIKIEFGIIYVSLLNILRKLMVGEKKEEERGRKKPFKTELLILDYWNCLIVKKNQKNNLKISFLAQSGIVLT